VRHEEKAHLREIHKSRPKKTEPLAIPASPEGTLKSKEASAAPPSGTATNPGARSIAPESGGTVGSGGGIGSDSVGARAIYHPVPKIPDDLRDQVFQTEAVAHFTFSYAGKGEVTLPKPTSNPRLNQILLDTLTQWTFFPAVEDGIAIDSVFDVRIPISVE
jgi:protein TonB